MSSGRASHPVSWDWVLGSQGGDLSALKWPVVTMEVSVPLPVTPGCTSHIHVPSVP